MSGNRINVCFVCGGKYHDFDFARLEILKLLHEHEEIRVRVTEDFSNTDAIEKADFLITYTCDVVPSEEQQQALKEFLNAGKRWFALHGTNSIINFLEFKPLKIGTPREAPLFMEMLGSQFLAHPPIDSYHVKVTEPEHPLVMGIESFDTTDELYLGEYHGECQTLLHTNYNGTLEEFEISEWKSDEPRPVLYLHPYANGEVLYFTLGHCRGKYDMEPLMKEYFRVERCSWELPVYYEILRRGIRWAARIE